MSDRITLSEHTYIEDGYMVTTSHEVAAAWMEQDSSEAWQDVYWRIPVSSLREVYGYREGEPWCHINTDGDIAIGTFSASITSAIPKGHLRAALPCDGQAESLRALHEAIEGEDDT